ncbi:hypothetical protein A8L34_05515 [Bacillus sp. FJAT-27264]|uniref:glycoside hydrolase family 36 protein n=1 Tax=Paenibacillus sp. (strain DSM 101736 / FJAT-27264) TaxID=1850362 RepID=UPI000807A358|nr:glycoside hydrolase family 36 protein [Bacillus sp. FJAT-27264]OBZ19003.1 hypothetical protein A8L34_05515 [Bacillus sp. FJAT-27264]
MTNLIDALLPTVNVVSEEDFFEISKTVERTEEHLLFIGIRLKAKRDGIPPVCTISWSIPALDIHSMWHPGVERNRAFQIDWGSGFNSRNSSQAPVTALLNLAGRNRMTFAFTDVLNKIEVKAGIHEEDSSFLCSLKLFEEPVPSLEVYEAVLRIDTRDIPYHEALAEVSRWWEQQPGLEPADVPDAALLPMYSTWYSYHQELTDAALEEECRLAREIGCDTIIVDDGWQTDDNNRGYAFTGDWEVCETKIPDMKAHVDRVHDLGMKYMLWYSVPFVGRKSRVWDIFKDKVLKVEEGLDAGVLDPRFPEVRDYLLHIYQQAVTEWGIDGLKLDFVDSFQPRDGELPVEGGGRDYRSIPEAVDRLFTDIMQSLKAIKPDILIEFRQSYIGPLMRKYGNIFRAGDCPNDSIQNRVRTLDLRLLSGDTAVHSDMIMFNPHEDTASSAMQFINSLFSVLQISVRLAEIGEEKLAMLRFWTDFSREYSDVLLRGSLSPQHPELLYPIVTANKDNVQVIACYAEMVITPEGTPERLAIVNGTYTDNVVVRWTSDPAVYVAVIKNCRGQVTEQLTLELRKGLLEVPVPRAGAAILTRLQS